MPLLTNIKECVIKINKVIKGDNKTYNALIERAIKIRKLRKFYKSSNEEKKLPKQKMLVYMADGKCMHGGNTDRLRAMASAFYFAKKHNLIFKIFHTSPFDLNEIFTPSKYDWSIDADSISYNNKQSKPVLLYRDDFDNNIALENQIDNEHFQFHLYSNVDSLENNFGELFNELFSPAYALKKELDIFENLSNEKYISISFRFQNLLGDFKEWKFKELKNDSDKKKLCGDALACIKNLFEKTQKRILVTADSPHFLEMAKALDYVVTVPGKSLHIDYNKSNDVKDYIKSFVEFILISRASHIYFYQNKKFKTYPSNFPQYAAKLANKTCEFI